MANEKLLTDQLDELENILMKMTIKVSELRDLVETGQGESQEATQLRIEYLGFLNELIY